MESKNYHTYAVDANEHFRGNACVVDGYLYTAKHVLRYLRENGGGRIVAYPELDLAADFQRVEEDDLARSQMRVTGEGNIPRASVCRVGEQGIIVGRVGDSPFSIKGRIEWDPSFNELIFKPLRKGILPGMSGSLVINERNEAIAILVARISDGQTGFMELLVE